MIIFSNLRKIIIIIQQFVPLFTTLSKQIPCFKANIHSGKFQPVRYGMVLVWYYSQNIFLHVNKKYKRRTKKTYHTVPYRLKHSGVDIHLYVTLTFSYLDFHYFWNLCRLFNEGTVLALVQVRIRRIHFRVQIYRTTALKRQPAILTLFGLSIVMGGSVASRFSSSGFKIS